MALRGAATTWTEGCDAPGIRNEYLAALIEPWAVWEMFGIPAAELHNQVVDLESLWPREGPRLYDRLSSAAHGADKMSLLGAALMESNSGREADARVKAYLHVCRRFAGAVLVREATEWLGPSRRQFRKRFEREIGVLPKRWSLLEKFAARVREIHPSSWGIRDELPVADYADQAHETHEFVRHSGVTPGFYRRLKLEGDPRVFMIPAIHTGIRPGSRERDSFSAR